MDNPPFLTVKVLVHAPLQKVWDMYTQAGHIIHWNFASEDWHCPKAFNDLSDGGKFSWHMAAKDRSFAFDFEGHFLKVIPLKSIEYEIADGRKVHLIFEKTGDEVLVTEKFQPESQNPAELQQSGWQAILNNFKKYAESH